jgi:hypothetical protein
MNVRDTGQCHNNYMCPCVDKLNLKDESTATSLVASVQVFTIQM